MKYFFIFFSVIIVSATTKSYSVELNLNECIERGIKNNKELSSVRAKLSGAEGLKLQAISGYLPKIEIFGTIAPLNENRGNALLASDSSHYGPWYKTDIKFYEPIFTFGRVGNYYDAANLNIAITKKEIEQFENELKFEIRKYYFASQYTRELVNLADSVIADIEKVNQEIGSAKKVTKRDLSKFEYYKAEAIASKADAQKSSRQALMALALKIGLSPSDQIEIKDKRFSPIETKIPELSVLVKQAHDERPEIHRLRNGVNAKDNLASAELKATFPNVLIGAIFNYSHTNLRDKQLSPYAYDPYNAKEFGVGLAVKWDIDIPLAIGKSNSIKAERNELEEKLLWAQNGVQAETIKSYEDVLANQTKLNERKNQKKITDKMFTQDMTGLSIGTVDTKDLLDGYMLKIKAAKDYNETIYDYNISLAELEKVSSYKIIQ